MSESKPAKEVSSYEKSMEELQYFLDIPIKVSVQLAHRILKVRDILRLQKNSIVGLPKSAGENVDIFMNDRLIAFGEVLELDNATGIRISDLNNPT